MSDLRERRLAAIDAALDHFNARFDDLILPGEVARADSDWAGDVRADAADWNETDHPRDPDGKFASGGGSAAFKAYAASAKIDKKTGKPKLQASGYIKHMLMQGELTVDEIFKELQKEFVYPGNQKPHVKYYHKELKAKGIDVPEIGSKKQLAAATEEVLKESGLKPEQAPKAQPSGGETKAPAKIPDADTWGKLGGKLGSNPGGKMVDPANGQEYYVKQSKSDDHAKNEVLASKLYALAGAPAVDSELVTTKGKLGTATKWHDDAMPIDTYSNYAKALAADNFAVHAWLANWDAAGLSFDNQAMVDGKMTTMDVGGSLLYRAQGEPKGDKFGPNVGEWESMRDPKVNPQNAEIFAAMPEEQLKKSAQKVADITDDQIMDMVDEFGPGDPGTKAKLIQTLIARRDDIAKKAGVKATGAAPPAPAPKKLELSEATMEKHAALKSAMHIVSLKDQKEFNDKISQVYAATQEDDPGEAVDLLNSIEGYSELSLGAKGKFNDFLESAKKDAETAFLAAPKNAEFEGKHDRNPDGTFKKGAGGDDEPEEPASYYAEPQSEETVKNLEFFTKYAPDEQKKLATKLANTKTEYPGTISGAVADLKNAVNQDNGPEKIAAIMAVDPIGSDTDGVMAEDPGVKAFNALLTNVKTSWEKDLAAPASKKVINPHADIYSQSSKDLFDELYTKMLAHKNLDEMNEADKYIDKIHKIASQADHKKAFTEMGTLTHLGLPEAFKNTAGNLTYEVYKDLMKKAAPGDHAKFYGSTPEEPPKKAKSAVAKAMTPPWQGNILGDLGAVTDPTKQVYEKFEEGYEKITDPNDFANTSKKINEINAALKGDSQKDIAAALHEILPLYVTPSLGKTGQYLNAYLTGLQIDFGQFLKKPKAAKGEKVATATKDFHEELKKHWPNTLPANLEAVQAQDAKIEAALSLDTLEDQAEALAAIEPLGGNGMAKQAMDSYLAKVKKDYLVDTPSGGPDKGKTTSKDGPATPKQAKAAKEISKLLPKRSNTESWHLDSEGKEVRAVLRLNTKEIANEGYEKVTAAYGGDLGNSLHHAVDSAMDEYAGPVWKTFSGPQHAAIQSYKGSGYININQVMLEGSIDKNPDTKKKINAISAAMKTSRLPADTPVFRGVRVDLKTFTGFDNPEDCIGKCFEHKNFASVSRRLETSQKFGTKTMIKMTLPAGMPAIVLPNDQTYGEREIILDAKSIFRIEKVEKTNYHDESYMLHVVYLGRREDE
jgi:hypothetical protein